MGKLTILPLALFVCSIAGGVAQQPAAPLNPSYEVASIKPSNATDNGATMMFGEGRLRSKNFPLLGLISFAYNIKSDTLLTNVPDWVKSERFDIDAKEEEEEAKEVAKLPQEERTKISRLMAQKLLTERLHLKLTPEQKELPVYQLVVAKGGVKMQPTKPPAEGQEPAAGPGGPRMRRGILMSSPGNFSGTDADIAILTNVLSHVPETSDRLVVDKTGLTGRYDFTLKWTPEMAGVGARGGDGTTAETGPSLFTALEEQLGLRLDRGKETVTTYRVESIDHPTEN